MTYDDDLGRVHLEIGRATIEDPEWRHRLRKTFRPGLRLDCPGEDFIALLDALEAANAKLARVEEELYGYSDGSTVPVDDIRAALSLSQESGV